jgi:hypothetical protein
MNSVFGLCGSGWQWEIVRVWNEPCAEGQVFAFAEVRVRVYDTDVDKWGEWIPGTGGHFLQVKEKNGLHCSDEGYKMAITDGLSVAFKFLGIGAEVYRGHDCSKYTKQQETPFPPIVADYSHPLSLIDKMSIAQSVKECDSLAGEFKVWHSGTASDKSNERKKIVADFTVALNNKKAEIAKNSEVVA